ncbi:hypothetical protein LINGRAHAP2_LOCUS18558 [Linum grandiflorum]
MASTAEKFSSYTKFFGYCTTASSFAVILCALNTEQFAQKLEHPAATIIFGATGLLLTLIGPFLANFTRLGKRPCGGNPNPDWKTKCVADFILIATPIVAGLGMESSRSSVSLLAALHLYVMLLMRVVKPAFDFHIQHALFLACFRKMLTVPGLGTEFRVHVLIVLMVVQWFKKYLEMEIESKWRLLAAAAAIKQD